MKFKIIYQKNTKLQKIIVEVNSQKELMRLEPFPQNVIKITEIKSLNFSTTIFQNKKQEVFELFSQLDIMLSSNLSFSESIDLLLKEKQEKKIYEILELMKKSLSSTIEIDEVLVSYKDYLGQSTLLFLKLGLENGNIKEAVHSLVEILHEEIISSEKLSEVMRYPLVLLGSLLVSLWMILIYVLPNFEFVFSLLKDDVPYATQVLLSLKNIIEHYSLYLILGILGLLIGVVSLVKRYRYFYDKILLLKIPILSKVIQNYYFYKLFLSISIIVKSKYQFQIAIFNSKDIVDNLYVKDTMSMILRNIKNGASVSEAFDKSDIFDNLTIKLLHTADYTNEYESILYDIAKQYKKRFHKSIKNFSSIIEPLLILVIALIVLWLILAIMLPIWNLGTIVN